MSLPGDSDSLGLGWPWPVDLPRNLPFSVSEAQWGLVLSSIKISMWLGGESPFKQLPRLTDQHPQPLVLHHWPRVKKGIWGEAGNKIKVWMVSERKDLRTKREFHWFLINTEAVCWTHGFGSVNPFQNLLSIIQTNLKIIQQCGAKACS